MDGHHAGKFGDHHARPAMSKVSGDERGNPECSILYPARSLRWFPSPGTRVRDTLPTFLPLSDRGGATFMHGALLMNYYRMINKLWSQTHGE
jgi:hypothetical protein